MEIRKKILDTIYKHNKSAYGASSECIEVVYDEDYDALTDDLVKLFSLHIVSVSLLETVDQLINVYEDRLTKANRSYLEAHNNQLSIDVLDHLKAVVKHNER